MSTTENNDEGTPKRSAMPQKLQDDLIYVILTSVNNISTQIDNLNKSGEELFAELSKEVDRVSIRLKPLQERIVQLTDDVLSKARNEGLALQNKEPEKTSGSETTETEQVYTSKLLPAKKCETQDASVQTSLLNIAASYHQDDRENLNIYPDIYSFELFEENITLERKEVKCGKLKQKKLIVHPSELEHGPQHQLTGVDMSMSHMPNAIEALPSCIEQSATSSSPSNIPFKEISKILTRTVGRVLTSPPRLPKHGAGDLKSSCSYVNYGTGVGEELQPQPRPRPKTEVFVSPLAPNSPPPLPPDWLSLLRASQKENNPSITHFQAQLSVPILRTPAATTDPDCLQTIPQSSVPITPPKADFSVRKPLQYCKGISDDLYQLGDDQEMPSTLSPSENVAVKLKDTVTDIVDCDSILQPQKHSVFQLSKSSSIQPPRSLVTKPPRPSIPTTPRFSRPPPPRFSVNMLPRSSTQQTSQNSSPQSLLCSCPQTTQFPSPRYSVAHVPRCPLAPSQKRLDAQAPKCSFAQSSRTSFARPTSVAQAQRPFVGQSTGNWIPPQSTSSLKSPKTSTLQSLFSFAQSPPSFYPRPQNFSVSGSSPIPVCPGLNESPSTTPKMTKGRDAMMEAIKKRNFPSQNER